jgi:ADP-ribose pyrophosphatase YjhB (NUDIX family)
MEREDGSEGIILIQRKNPPLGWALPGGFVDYNESLEDAARREAEEETGLKIELKRQLHTYSDPSRDPRGHTITTVYIAEAKGTPVARDDARNIGIFSREEIVFPLAFDHAGILSDYFALKKTKNKDTYEPSLRKQMTDKEDNHKTISPDAKLKEVCKVWGPAEAEVIKSYLESNGIPSLLRTRVPHSIIPLTSDGLGEVKILVLDEDYETAKKLLETLEPLQEEE